MQEKLNFTYEELHESLWKYARWKSSCDGNKGHWLLNKDDLYSEYIIITYKCYEKYASKEGMTLGALKAICKSAMRNKFRSMLTYCFQTHRIAEKESKELDNMDTNVKIPGNSDPAISREEKGTFVEIMSELDSVDVKVLDVIIGNNERAELFLDLHRRRMSFCLSDKDINLTPHIIASALCRSESEIEESLERIRKILQKRNEFEFFPVISNRELIWI